MGSISGSKSGSQQDQAVNEAQAPFLQDLYQQAQTQFQDFQPNQDVYNTAQGGFNNLVSGQQNPNLAAYGSQFQNQLGALNQNTGGQAGLSNNYGGGRQGVLESQNQQNVGDQVSRFYGDQYQGDQNRVLGALGQAGNINALSPQQQQNQALNQYAGQIGGPTVLGSGSSSAKSAGGGIG